MLCLVTCMEWTPGLQLRVKRICFGVSVHNTLVIIHVTLHDSAFWLVESTGHAPWAMNNPRFTPWRKVLCSALLLCEFYAFQWALVVNCWKIFNLVERRHFWVQIWKRKVEIRSASSSNLESACCACTQGGARSRWGEVGGRRSFTAACAFLTSSPLPYLQCVETL